jgi:hypothetical protein
MSSSGIAAVYLETHNWGRAAGFFRSLGFELDFETDHHSGQLSAAGGPPVFVAEVPPDRVPGLQIVLRVPDESTPVDVDPVAPFADTHFGTREMTVRDPDGRLWTLQAPAGG